MRGFNLVSWSFPRTLNFRTNINTHIVEEIMFSNHTL